MKDWGNVKTYPLVLKIYPIEWTAKSVETRIVDRKKGLRNIEILERGHKKVYAARKQFYGEISDELEDIHA